MGGGDGGAGAGTGGAGSGLGQGEAGDYGGPGYGFAGHSGYGYGYGQAGSDYGGVGFAGDGGGGIGETGYFGTPGVSTLDPSVQYVTDPLTGRPVQVDIPLPSPNPLHPDERAPDVPFDINNPFLDDPIQFQDLAPDERGFQPGITDFDSRFGGWTTSPYTGATSPDTSVTGANSPMNLSFPFGDLFYNPTNLPPNVQIPIGSYYDRNARAVLPEMGFDNTPTHPGYVLASGGQAAGQWVPSWAVPAEDRQGTVAFPYTGTQASPGDVGGQGGNVAWYGPDGSFNYTAPEHTPPGVTPVDPRGADRPASAYDYSYQPPPAPPPQPAYYGEPTPQPAYSDQGPSGGYPTSEPPPAPTYAPAPDPYAYDPMAYNPFAFDPYAAAGPGGGTAYGGPGG